MLEKKDKRRVVARIRSSTRLTRFCHHDTRVFGETIEGGCGGKEPRSARRRRGSSKGCNALDRNAKIPRLPLMLVQALEGGSVIRERWGLAEL